MTPQTVEMSNYSLSIGRRIGAPVTTVFDGWLDADLVRAWMKPRPEVTVEDVEINPTVGGAFRIVMRANGRDELHEGVYRVIDRPNRLSFTWTSAPAGPDTNVDLTFLTTSDEETMVLLKHDRLANRASIDNHREGWRRILDSLARTLEQSR